LLLVAARQGRDRLAGAGVFQVEPRAEGPGHLRLAALVDEEAVLRDLFDAQHRDVRSDRHVEEQTVALAVFRQIDDAARDAVRVAEKRDRLAVQQHFATGLAFQPADAAGDLAAPRADQSGKADDLSL